MKRMFIVVLVMMISSQALAQSVSDAERAYFKLWMSNDATAASQLLHRNYHFVGADGEVHDRQWAINMIGSGQVTYDSVSIEGGPEIRQGDIRIRIGKITAPGTENGQQYVDQLAFTMVWHLSDGRWKLLSEHVTQTAPQPEP